jgi:hypothetical protein
MNRRHDIEPYWRDEDGWLCTNEFFPSIESWNVDALFLSMDVPVGHAT